MSPTTLIGIPVTKTKGDPGPTIGVPARDTPIAEAGLFSMSTLGIPVATCPQVAKDPAVTGGLGISQAPPLY